MKNRKAIKNLGKKIKSTRESHDKTQEEVCSDSGRKITISSLSKIESGVTKDPSISMIKDIAQAFKIPIDKLIS